MKPRTSKHKRPEPYERAKRIVFEYKRRVRRLDSLSPTTSKWDKYLPVMILQQSKVIKLVALGLSKTAEEKRWADVLAKNT